MAWERGSSAGRSCGCTASASLWCCLLGAVFVFFFVSRGGAFRTWTPAGRARRSRKGDGHQARDDGCGWAGGGCASHPSTTPSQRNRPPVGSVAAVVGSTVPPARYAAQGTRDRRTFELSSLDEEATASRLARKMAIVGGGELPRDAADEPRSRRPRRAGQRPSADDEEE